MKHATEYFWFNTPEHRAYLNITDDVSRVVTKCAIQEGFILVSAMHITAGVFINDDEPGILEDLDNWLEQLAPTGPDYLHHNTGETNADSHLKNILVGHQVIVPITKGQLDLGPWQQVFYAEFDGRRRKRLMMKVIGE